MMIATHQALTHGRLFGILFSVALHAILLFGFTQAKHLPSLMLDARPVHAIAPLQVMLLHRNITPLATIHVATRRRLDLAADVPSSPLTVLQNSVNTVDAANTAEPVAPLISPSMVNEKLAEPAATRHSTATPESSARPDYAYNPAPEYPMVLREHGVGGTVWLRVWVDSEGRPADVKLAKGSGYRLFDEAAMRVVALWRFIPARAGEQKLASWVEFPIRFTLNG